MAARPLKGNHRGREKACARWAGSWESRATMTNPSGGDGHLQRVRAYYDTMTPLYLKHLGHTLQAGLFAVDGKELGPAAHTRHLAARIGIRPGARVLDAGCGVCGPAVELARAVPGVTVEGITLSPEQAETARGRIEAAGLAERVRVTLGDYHALPFADGTFDLVWFLESAGHTIDLGRMLREAQRVLKPGGRIYVKDTFVPETPLTAAEQKAQDDFCRLYVYRIFTLAEFAAAATAAGFQDVRAQSIHDIMQVKRFANAMFERQWGLRVLSDFGREHASAFATLKILWGEILARKA